MDPVRQLIDQIVQGPQAPEAIRGIRDLLARARPIGAARTAVADLSPEHTADAGDTPTPELSVALDMPGKVADFLRTAERTALNQGVTVRRGQGYTLRVTTTPATHRQLLTHCQTLDAPLGDPDSAQGPPRVCQLRQRPRGRHP